MYGDKSKSQNGPGEDAAIHWSFSESLHDFKHFQQKISCIFIVQYKAVLEKINIWTQHIMMNIIKPCDLSNHVCWFLKLMLMFSSLSTYAGMPLNSSEVINGISLILLCSLEGFFVALGSSTLTGSSELWSDTFPLQKRDAQHIGNRQNCTRTRKKSVSRIPKTRR